MASAAPNDRSIPRDAVELVVHRAFCDVLGVESVDLETPFLEQGGHSLTVLVLQERLHEATGQLVDLDVLFVGGSVEALAAELRGNSGFAPPKHLSALANVTGKTLYCVHSVVGTALRYRDLAGILSAAGVQVRAYQAPGLLPGSAPLRDVREMAALYVKELLEDQPSEVFLFGYSMGASVVYQMAALLLDHGIEVAHLFLVDTYAPGADPENEPDTLSPAVHLANSLDGDWDATILDQFELSRAYRALFEHLSDTRRIPATYGLSDIERLGAVVEAHTTAVSSYLPGNGRLRTPITVFSVPDDDAQASDLGWSDYTSGEVNAVGLSAPHHKLLAFPAVETIAAEIVKVMR